MSKDKEAICTILETWIASIQENYDYRHTAKCVDDLAAYINKARVEALGWCYSEVCICMEGGQDIRAENVDVLIARAIEDLTKPKHKSLLN